MVMEIKGIEMRWRSARWEQHSRVAAAQHRQSSSRVEEGNMIVMAGGINTHGGEKGQGGRATTAQRSEGTAGQRRQRSSSRVEAGTGATMGRGASRNGGEKGQMTRVKQHSGKAAAQRR